MTTKVVDSTVSQLLQDNSSVEYVSPEENPIATIPNETQNCVSSNPLFDLHAEHNGEHCIASLDPKDTRENRFWFTIAMFCTIYKESHQTIRNNIESLYQDGELGDSKIFERRINIEDSWGVPHPTTIYNLTVLNRLGMCCFRKNKEAKKVRDKFNDVLIKHETQAQPTIYDYARALIAEKERSDALEAQNKALTVERDEAIRTKYHFVEGRDAKVCGELGGLRTQNEALRKQIGDSKTYKAATAIAWLPDYFDMSNRGLYNALAHKLKKLEAEMPPAFAHIDIQDSRWGSVKAYHVAVVERLHEMVQSDESLMQKYRKIASV